MTELKTYGTFRWWTYERKRYAAAYAAYLAAGGELDNLPTGGDARWKRVVHFLSKAGAKLHQHQGYQTYGGRDEEFFHPWS